MTSLKVLVANDGSGDPIVGSRTDNGEACFSAHSPYKPCGVIAVATAAGHMKVPVFDENQVCYHDDAKLVDLKTFISNELILQVGGYDKADFLQVLSMSDEALTAELDEQQYELATRRMNETDCENAQEEILLMQEKLTSDIINQGRDSVILTLLSATRH